jgi:hypothetical protein
MVERMIRFTAESRNEEEESRKEKEEVSLPSRSLGEVWPAEP